MLPSSMLVPPPYPQAQPDRQTPSAESSNQRLISRSREFERTTFQTVSKKSGDPAREGRLAYLWLRFNTPNFVGSRPAGSYT
jgi:hypothetical protein